MSSVRIQVINPNTSLAMTETIGAAARAVAALGTEILAVCPRAGVPSIEGHFDEAIAAVGVLEQIRAGREQGVDGHVIACFGDPGLLAARELLRRQPDKADRRVIHLALTDAGAALAREGQKLQSTCLDALFAGLTQSEAERFQELLEKVLTSAEVRLKEGGNT